MPWLKVMNILKVKLTISITEKVTQRSQHDVIVVTFGIKLLSKLVISYFERH